MPTKYFFFLFRFGGVGWRPAAHPRWIHNASCYIPVIMSNKYSFTHNKYVMYSIYKIQYKLWYPKPLRPDSCRLFELSICQNVTSNVYLSGPNAYLSVPNIFIDRLKCLICHMISCPVFPATLSISLWTLFVEFGEYVISIIPTRYQSLMAQLLVSMLGAAKRSCGRK